jgi:hypothetical protein
MVCSRKLNKQLYQHNRLANLWLRLEVSFCVAQSLLQLDLNVKHMCAICGTRRWQQFRHAFKEAWLALLNHATCLPLSACFQHLLYCVGR